MAFTRQGRPLLKLGQVCVWGGRVWSATMVVWSARGHINSFYEASPPPPEPQKGARGVRVIGVTLSLHVSLTYICLHHWQL